MISLCNNLLARRIALLLAFIIFTVFIASFVKNNYGDDNFISYIADPQKQQIKLYWKDSAGNYLKSIGNLKKLVEANYKHLIFAMNGGIYQQGNIPLGLFIDDKKTVTPLNKRTAFGNFYLQPNGVFCITSSNKAFITTTTNFDNSTATVKYATQSGPILVIKGAINLLFTKSSTNTNIRNGVGIFPDGTVLFAMSKKEINFYDFASYFQQAGCTDALYLDGYVSRSFLPSKNWVQLDGDFGVMIGIAE